MHKAMKIRILGSGTSTGVPVIGCSCPVCRSKEPKNQRLRTSAWIETKGKHFIIDTSTDFRQQALRYKIPRVDAVLITHPHTDHIAGLDELRAYNFLQASSIPVFGSAWTGEELKARFSYIFSGRQPEGGGIPELELRVAKGATENSCFDIDVCGVSVRVLPLRHGSQICWGYRIKSIAYVTDCQEILPESLENLSGLRVLILDCLRLRAHPTHLHLDRALEYVRQLNPERTYFTHLGHDFDYRKWKRRLPKNIQLAYDGLTIQSQ